MSGKIFVRWLAMCCLAAAHIVSVAHADTTLDPISGGGADSRIPPLGSGPNGSGPGTTTATLVTLTSCNITDINVTLDIAHTYDADLDMSISSPAGTTRRLTQDNGGSADNFTGTTFDDEAGTSIGSGSAPFSGSYRPNQTLSNFDSQNTAGTWTLTVFDDADVDIGTLNSWSITLTTNNTVTNYYRDADGDGFGNLAIKVQSCNGAPSGYVTNSTDCNDSNAAIKPTATEVCDASNVDEDCDSGADDSDPQSNATGKTTFYRDADSDLFGNPSVTQQRCDANGTYIANNTDCDDSNAAIKPGGQEVCDAGTADEDCDTLIDDADGSVSAVGKTTYYQDNDSDTYGNASVSLLRCDLPLGYVTNSTDCNDAASSAHPGGSEVCDAGNIDEDCDGLTDDSDLSATGQTSWYPDVDADGYGATSGSVSLCEQPLGYLSSNNDCNDAKNNINPGAPEVCDASNGDEDCDSTADDADLGGATGKTPWYTDGDSDGFGAGSATQACDQPSGQVSSNTDCNDAKNNINPGAPEVCDASNGDEDCDNTADDADLGGATGKTSWYTDGDSDGFGAGSATQACDQPNGMVSSSTDCNDANAAIKPTAQEVCDASNVDEDCDSTADDADLSGATGKTSWYTDGDSDGFGAGNETQACDQPGSQVSNNTDCNDSNAAIKPTAQEVCDVGDVDEDCDNTADDADSSAMGQSTWYADVDADGYGDLGMSQPACNQPVAYVGDSTDCDDTDGAIHPMAQEICDENDVDEDCDMSADDADLSATGQTTWYEDLDSDGYGNSAVTQSACDQPAGYAPEAAVCGDSVVNTDGVHEETCDDGNTENTDACLNTCAIASCGDTYVQTGEEACDDGNADNTDACLDTCAAASCGDSFVHGGTEDCDAGVESETCNIDCTFAECGDSKTNITAGETCDAGAESADCNIDCTTAACGDSKTNMTAGETCDDGSNDGGEGECVPGCMANQVCGDGVMNGSETCDDGNQNNYDACPDGEDGSCQTAFCGDGFPQDEVEECDKGAENSDTAADACRTDCVMATCGDDVIDTEETCDDGVNNSDSTPGACRTNCALASCGNGNIDAGEDCDDGVNNSDTGIDKCRTTCVMYFCGDSVIDSGEECDDSNFDSEDGCSDSCEKEDRFICSGIPSVCAPDSDEDGLSDESECPGITAETTLPEDCPNSDTDKVPDYLDTDGDGSGPGDSDGDGIDDDIECPNGVPCPDTDDDGIPDQLDNDGHTLPDDGPAGGGCGCVIYRSTEYDYLSWIIAMVLTMSAVTLRRRASQRLARQSAKVRRR